MRNLTFWSRHACLGLIAITVVGARPVFAQPARSSAGKCYHLSYRATAADSPDELYAGYVSLEPGRDSLVRSGMGSKRQDFWRMFLIGGTWSQHADTLELHFTNGFSGVLYKLVPAGGGSLRGQVWFLYDVVDQRPPPSGVTATPIPCAQAHLQTPPGANRAWAAGRRASRQREQRNELERRRLRGMPSPVAGTYRFVVTTPGAPPIILYGRTEAHPGSPLWAMSGPQRFEVPDGAAARHAPGYQLRMAVTLADGSLPVISGDNDRGGAALAYFSIRQRPIATSADSSTWDGDLDVLFAASRLIGEQPLDSLLLRASGAVSDVWFGDVPGQTVGRFTVHGNGRATVMMRVVRRGREVLAVRGERISRVTLRGTD